MKLPGKLLKGRRGVAAVFFLVALTTYAASTRPIGILGQQSQSTAVHFSYLAEAFLNGRLDLAVTPEEVTRLTELVPQDGKYYVVYPPMPAVLLMPFVAVFGKTFPTRWFAILLAAVSVSLMYVLLRRAEIPSAVSAWVTVLFGFGTTFWYTSLSGSSWYIAHVVAVFFLIAALVEAYGKRRPLLIGSLLGAATLSRLPVVMATPFFVYALVKSGPKRTRDAFLMFVGLGVFCGLNVLYNWLRYRSVLDVGYYQIPGVLDEPWYRDGILSVRYVPRNLFALLFQPPVLVDHFPYLVPTTFGLALFFTTPALILLLDAPVRTSTLALLLAAFFVSIPGLLHGWPGGTQFGYRFSLDYTPFLLLVTAQAMGNRVSARARLLIVTSCAISLWGIRYATWIPPQWLFQT